MAPQHIAFRSKSEREREQTLLKHYREIGIAAIAAAAAAIRHRPANTLVAVRTQAESAQ